MTKKSKRVRLTKRQAERYKEQFEINAVEIASLIQALIRQRIERALESERELDELMEKLLYHAEYCEDKVKSKSIISKFESIKIEDLTKLASVLKTVCQTDYLGKKDTSDTKVENVRQIKFEDIYDL